MRLKHLLPVVLCLLAVYPAKAYYGPQQKMPVVHIMDTVLIYKKIDTVSLKLRFLYPEAFRADKTYPAMVFFFGGGWTGGKTTQFEKQAKYFASRGMVTILADYRIFSKHKTSPFEAVKDARSALRYLRGHGAALHIDTARIVTSGGSAGGHLAMACDLIAIDEAGEDLTISTRPKAVVAFNPVLDNGPGGYGYERIGDRYPEFSPIHNVKNGAAPCILFFGTKDKFVPVSTAQLYQQKMEAAGNKCELHIYEGQGHGFFNYKINERPVYFLETLKAADLFLSGLGILKGPPTVDQYDFEK